MIMQFSSMFSAGWYDTDVCLMVSVCERWLQCWVVWISRNRENEKAKSGADKDDSENKAGTVVTTESTGIVFI